MDPTKNKKALVTEPIGPLIRGLAIPVSIGFFFNTMFNVVDTKFAGLISTQALAALGLSFPIFFLIISIGSGVSTGATALIGTELGRDDDAEARRYAMQGISFGLLTGVGLMILGPMISPPLCRMLGATDPDYLNTALNYVDTILYGAVFFVMVYMFNATLQAQGDTRKFRNFLVAGSIVNIGLDPWFIYGGLGVPEMGIAGIALATLVVQAAGAVYLGVCAYRTGIFTDENGNGATWRDFIPRRRYFAEIAVQGFPSSLNYMTIALGIFVITYYISQFGPEAVAAYGVATRIEQIVLLPTIGLTVSTLTLVAQNNGAGNYDRICETVSTSLKYGATIMVLGTVVIFFFCSELMGLFTGDEVVIGHGAQYLQIAAFVLYAYVILFVNVSSLQGMRRPMFGVWVGLGRQIVAPVALFHLLVFWLDVGIIGIWWGIAGIVWVSAIFVWWYSRGFRRRVFMRNWARHGHNGRMDREAPSPTRPAAPLK